MLLHLNNNHYRGAHSHQLLSLTVKCWLMSCTLIFLFIGGKDGGWTFKEFCQKTWGHEEYVLGRSKSSVTSWIVLYYYHLNRKVLWLMALTGVSEVMWNGRWGCDVYVHVCVCLIVLTLSRTVLVLIQLVPSAKQGNSKYHLLISV